MVGFRKRQTPLNAPPAALSNTSESDTNLGV
jgi:hypothetical protein